MLEAEGYDGSRGALTHADDAQLRAMAIFDIVVDNADRKGGHVLCESDGTLRGVDHGLTFNVEDKLRTVLWGWGGERLDTEELARLEQLAGLLEGALGAELTDLLDVAEVERTRDRLDRLRSRARFPRPGGRRPAIPWPAF